MAGEGVRKRHLVKLNVVFARVEGLCLAIDAIVPPPAAAIVVRTFILDVGNAPAQYHLVSASQLDSFRPPSALCGA
jgi:hypothetical protein